MKTNVFYLFAIIFSILSNNIFAQDEFYNNNKTTETVSNKVDSVDVGSYSTAEDYNSVENDSKKGVYEQEEAIDENEKEQERKYRKRANAEFVAEFAVDVFINAIFILGALWQ